MRLSVQYYQLKFWKKSLFRNPHNHMGPIRIFLENPVFDFPWKLGIQLDKEN